MRKKRQVERRDTYEAGEPKRYGRMQSWRMSIGRVVILSVRSKSGIERSNARRSGATSGKNLGNLRSKYGQYEVEEDSREER